MTEATKTKQNYLMPIWQIAQKEWRGYFHSHLAWGVIAFFLLIAGLLGYFYVKFEKTSFLAMQRVFYTLSGTTMFVTVLISMRLFAEERSKGTLELLITAPITEGQMTAGKYLSAVLFLLVWITLTLPLPFMVIFYSEAHWGQMISGYLGVFLIGAASIAVTMFYSTLTKVQLLAAVMGGGNVVIFLLLGFFSPYVGTPMKEIMRELSFYVHYMDFEKGVIVLRHLVFFIGVIVFYVYLSVISLQARRWR